jgi:hypothetical protein
MQEQSSVTSRVDSLPALNVERILSATAVAACAGMIVYKLILVRLLNVNWDEFSFLSLVYQRARGELTAVMQGAFTHAFAWLPAIPGDEMDQVLVARYAMVLLLALTAWLIWRLARIWLHGFAALVPVFVYLSFIPVMEHGGSFRFDSILAPLSVAPLVLLLAPGFGPRRDWFAGALLGIGFAVSVKVVLFAPVVLVTVLLQRKSDRDGVDWRAAAHTLARVAGAAALVAVLLIGLHWFAIAPIPQDSVAEFAGSAVRKTLLDVPWFPRSYYFARSFDWQPYPWLMIGLGALIALVRRDFTIAALGLSLVPLAFYRNAYPYYYVIMLAPASILAGYAIAVVWKLVRLHASAVVSNSLVAVLWLGFIVQAIRFGSLLAFDDQVLQRQTLAAVHQIFPAQVNYIDRCGMVPSFRKVGFFMSTWGVEDYRARGEPFLPGVLSTDRPAFMLMNTNRLDPANKGPRGLLPEDRALVARYFLEYWGPIRVAGGRGLLESTDPVAVTVPYAAEYRLVSSEPVLVNGEVRHHGDVIAVPAEGVTVARKPGSAGEAISISLILATAQAPPSIPPAGPVIFREL